MPVDGQLKHVMQLSDIHKQSDETKTVQRINVKGLQLSCLTYCDRINLYLYLFGDEIANGTCCM